MKQFLRNYLLAIQFFTRIPITGEVAQWVGYSPAMLRESAAHFPGVGWVVGALSAVVFAAGLWALPAQAASVWVAVVLSTVFSVLLTGAFHEDGLADTADGLGGGFTREKVLEIMKDSRIGTYGAIALILVIFCKVSLLVLLSQAQTSWALMGLFIAHVTSRFTPLFLIRTMEHVGNAEQSKSKPLAESISNKGVLVGAVWWIVAMILTSYSVPVVVLCAGAVGAMVAALWMAWRLNKRLQGFTGDGLGATQQLSEIGFYLGAVFALGFQ